MRVIPPEVCDLSHLALEPKGVTEPVQPVAAPGPALAVPEISEREWREIVRGGDWHGAIATNFRTGSREVVTTAQLEQVVLTIARAHHQVCDEMGKLKDEIVLLKRALEHTMQYEDTWKQHRTYTRGAVVTFDGGMWIACDTTNSRPKTDDTWHLCVKSGMAPK